MNFQHFQQSPQQGSYPSHEPFGNPSSSLQQSQQGYSIPNPQRQLPSLPHMASARPQPQYAPSPYQQPPVYYSQHPGMQNNPAYSGHMFQAAAAERPQYYAVTPQASAQQQEQIPPTPPSPTESEGPESEEIFRRQLQAPPEDSRKVDGKKYKLEIFQEPIRARMCGYGDKDRRPISTAPILKAVIWDEEKDEEINYKEADFEISHLVCYAHLYDKYAKGDKSTLRNSLNTLNIHSSENTAYPPAKLTADPELKAVRVPSTDAIYQYNSRGSIPAEYAGVQPQNGRGPFSTTNSAGPSMYPRVLGPPEPVPGLYCPAPSPYNNQPPTQPQHSASGYHTPVGPIQPPTPPPHVRDDDGNGEAKHLSQNLIGNNVQSGQLLEDLDGKHGIFFIFSDLSVRNEGWFRLKFTLFNMGLPLKNMTPEERFQRCESTNSTPTSGPNVEAARTGAKRLEGMYSGLLRDTAPCVATIFSQGFKVYSAKKFPGVAEGTPLMKKFADQGAKISVRKDNSKDGKRKRSDTKGDSDESDGDDD